MKYIDAEKLIAEIDSILSSCTKQTHTGVFNTCTHIKGLITSLQQEQPEVDLEKFTEKMDAWKARYNNPDSIPIKATMAFTARMFYMYPNAAREWYDSLPKVTLD